MQNANQTKTPLSKNEAFNLFEGAVIEVLHDFTVERENGSLIILQKGDIHVVKKISKKGAIYVNRNMLGVPEDFGFLPKHFCLWSGYHEPQYTNKAKPKSIKLCTDPILYDSLPKMSMPTPAATNKAEPLSILDKLKARRNSL